VQAGYNCVYCPTAELYHYEGKTRGYKDDPREEANFRRMYSAWVDRWYNPNLSLEADELFEPQRARLQARSRTPVRVLFVSHNLNREGAPLVLFDLISGLTERGSVCAEVLSPQDGPLRAEYEKRGITVHLLADPLPGADHEASLRASLEELGGLFTRLKAEVVVANTLSTFWAVAGASTAKIPVLWCQHESEPWQNYFDYLPDPARQAAYSAFAVAYKVLYVAQATRQVWSPLNTKRNFEVIPHGIPATRLDEDTSRWSRKEARTTLGLADEDVVICTIGTVCARKGQLDLIDAIMRLPPDVQTRVRILIVGKDGHDGYYDELVRQRSRLPAELMERVVLTGPTNDPFLYYRASDIFVCTSRIESAPRVIVEAMACSLPIITTPVYGIPEQVAEGINALYYHPWDVSALAKSIKTLVENVQLRSEMGAKSPAVLARLAGYDDMIRRYDGLVNQAVMLAPLDA
jgi:glycosyltransferase involved in cell wall biosynthesis